MEEQHKILVIDDHENIRENIADYLSTSGFIVSTAKDGAEGIQLALTQQPDLIICDIEMPIMDGHAVIKTLEEIPATAGIPFIYLTARTTPQDFRTGMQLGADDYITKPFRFNDLLSAISKRLERVKRFKALNENKFQALVENPLVGMFIYLNESFLFINKKFSEITGYTLTDLNKMKPEDVLNENNLKHIEKEVVSVLNGLKDQLLIDFHLLSKEKELLGLKAYAKPINIKGQHALIGSILDITRQENIEAYQSLKTLGTDFEEILKMLGCEEKENELCEELLSAIRLYNIKSAENSQKTINVPISKREKEVLQLICEGYTNNEISERLFISQRTVDRHRANLLMKTEVKNTAALVAFAFKNHLVEY